MGWWNRTEEDYRLMRGPLSGYTPILPWNQDANIRYNRARELEAAKQAKIASNPTLQMRLQAEAEAKAKQFKPQPIGYEAYGPYDGWGQPAGHSPVYSEADLLRLNKINDEKLDQQLYNEEMGVTYSGGPTQAVVKAPLAAIHQGSDPKAAGVIPKDATVYDPLKSYFNPETGEMKIVL